VEERIALIIGNGAYSRIGRLANPTNDAALVGGALMDLGFDLIGGGIYLDIDKPDFEQAIVEFSKRLHQRAIRSEISRLTLEAPQRPVLIVDEAHHLRNEVLEDLRLLTNYQMDSENRLCLLRAGLTELRRRLAMAVHESLAQRIVVRYHLAGLTREELPAYLTHRLRLTGCELPLFESPAV